MIVDLKLDLLVVMAILSVEISKASTSFKCNQYLQYEERVHF